MCVEPSQEVPVKLLELPHVNLSPAHCFLAVISTSGSPVDIGCFVLWGARGEGFQSIAGK